MPPSGKVDFDFAFIWAGLVIDNNTGGATLLMKLTSELAKKYKVCIVMVKDIHSFLENATGDSRFLINTQKSLFYRIFLYAMSSKLLYVAALRFLKVLGRETVLDLYDIHNISIIPTNCDMTRIKRYKIRFMVSNGWETAWVADRYNGDVFQKFQIFQYGINKEDLEDYIGPLYPYAQQTVDFKLKFICINKPEYEKFRDKGAILMDLGINGNEFYRDSSIKKDGNVVLFVLRKHKEKGAVFAVDAIRLLVQKHPELRIIAFGDYPKELVPDTVDFRGFVPTNELRKLYNQASIFVFPSIGEGFGLTGLEAMACGCSLVASDNIGIREYVSDGENGIIVRPGNGKAIADGVEYLLENRQIAVRISENGIKTARQKNTQFTASSLIAGIESEFPGSLL